jgi:putative transposase
MPEKSRPEFDRRLLALKKYVNFEPVLDITVETGVSRSCLIKMLERALEASPTGGIYGFGACIPNLRIKPYQRSKPIAPKMAEAKGGHSGLLTYTLQRFPDLEKDLVKRILKLGNGGIREKAISAAHLHKFFLCELRKLGVADHEWPFAAKYQGINSLRDFIDRVLAENFGRYVIATAESEAMAHMPVGRGYKSLLMFTEPYECVEIDAHRIDALLTAKFEAPEGGTVDRLLERLWILAIKDRVAKCIYATLVVYSSQVNAADIVQLFRKAIHAHQPLDITIDGLSYPKNGGLPFQALEECRGGLFTSVFFDNALAHLAERVHKDLRQDLGMCMNYGGPRHFERRPNIENWFGKLEQEIFHRYPSTTGSNPSKGRAKDADKAAVAYQIRVDEAEQLIDYYTAAYNNTPNEGISFRSPLEFLEYHCRETEHFMVRKLPTFKDDALQLAIKCKVKGSVAAGRRPHINFQGVKYTNPQLSSMPNLIGAQITIRVDERDIRKVQAYHDNGTSLGTLIAAGRWSATPHDLKTRKSIRSLQYKRLLLLSPDEDPIEAYLSHLTHEKRKTRNNKPRKVSSKTTNEVLRVAKGAQLPLRIPPEAPLRPQVNRMQNPPSFFDKPMPNLQELLRRNDGNGNR